MTDKEKKEINDQVNENIYGKKFDSKKHFRHGMLKRHLIMEAGSKVSNKLNIISGEEKVKKITNLQKTINVLKYKLPEYGECALVQNHIRPNESFAAEVIEWDDFGTGILYYLKIKQQEISKNSKSYSIEKEYKLDPRFPDLNKFVVKTIAYDVTSGDEIGIEQLNKILGRRFYTKFEVLKTPYIPAEVFLNTYDGESDIYGLEEIFLLERQLLKELQRDLDLSRKKILYKTRLARKSKGTLEVEMNNDSIIVFEDGNAVFTSPIDLWAPALALETITKTIDWLVNYTLKMKFAAKDSMATGAQKTDEQVSELNQAAQNYLEEKKEMLSLYMNQFLRKVLKDKTIEVEFQLMTTIDRLVNGVEDPKNPPKPTEEE